MSKVSEIITAVMTPANKLIDAVTGAIGKAYEPRHVRKMADAKAYEINAIGQALRDNADIEIQYDRQAIAANTSDFDEFVKRTQSRLAFQELQKQQNIESVTDKAYNILSDETECSGEPVDEDWMIRFFNSVEDISDEDMQFLWAKILAGEVKQPKSFSLRTLETLKNLSKHEAVLFEKISKLKMVTDNDIYFPNYKSYMKQNGVKFDELLLLDECGLLSIRPNIVSSIKISHNKLTSLLENENIQIMALSNSKYDKEVKISIFPFTKMGIEISQLFESNVSDENMLLFARILRGELHDLNSLQISDNFQLFAYELTDLNHEKNLLN